jgi:hypothetical protein
MAVKGTDSSPGRTASDPQKPFGTTFAERAAAFLGIAFAIGLAALRAARSDGIDSVAGPLDPIAFGAVYGLPGFLALAGTRRRPALYLASGVLAPLLAFTALSGVALPLFIPAGMALVSYGRRAGQARGVIPDAAVALVCFVFVVGSFAALLVHQDPRCVSTANSSGCTSDVLTSFEAVLASALATVTLGLGWFLSAPRSDHAV